MMGAIGFLLLLAISPSFQQSGSIKICVVSGNSTTDESWKNTIDSIALFIAKNHSKSPQIYEFSTNSSSGTICEFVGAIDRAKTRADFILVAKKISDPQFNCDPEWGRKGFAVLNFNPANYKPVSKIDENLHFSAKLSFVSTEKEAKKWFNVTSSKRLTNLLRPHFSAPISRIPDEYPFKAEREERMKRRTLKAVIALMGLAVCSLLVIMFLGSLSRYKETKKQRDQEAEKQKKLQEQKDAPEAPPTSQKSEKSEKVEKSQKSEKKPLLEKSEKSGKSEKSEKKEK